MGTGIHGDGKRGEKRIAENVEGTLVDDTFVRGTEERRGGDN